MKTSQNYYVTNYDPSAKFGLGRNSLRLKLSTVEMVTVEIA